MLVTATEINCDLRAPCSCVSLQVNFPQFKFTQIVVNSLMNPGPYVPAWRSQKL